MRLRPVPFIALGLALTLASAIGTVLLLDEKHEREDRQARDRLADATFSVQAVGVASSHRIAVVLSLSSDLQAPVVGADVEGDGWKAVHGKAVSLVRSVDCKTAPPQPTAAHAVVELHGQRRSIDLLADPSVFDVVVSTSKEACGDTDASRALSLSAGPATRKGTAIGFTVTMTNRSVHLVRVTGFAVAGGSLGQTSRPLPIVLGVRETRSLRVAVTADCRTPPTSEVRVLVTGQGGPGSVPVTSTRLQTLLESLCP